MKVHAQVVIATHKPSGNIKLYRTIEYAHESVQKSADNDLTNWKFEHEYVWSKN